MATKTTVAAIDFNSFKVKDIVLPRAITGTSATNGKELTIPKGARIFASGQNKDKKLYQVLHLDTMQVIHIPFEQIADLIGTSKEVRDAKKKVREEIKNLPKMKDLAAALRQVEETTDPDDLYDYIGAWTHLCADLNNTLSTITKDPDADPYRVGQYARTLFSQIGAPQRVIRDLKEINPNILTGGILTDETDEEGEGEGEVDSAGTQQNPPSDANLKI